MKRSNRWRLDTKRRQSSLNSINRTIAQWTSSSRFLFHLYLDFRRFLSTIFLLVALDWSVDRIAFATRSTWISHMSYCLYWLQETWFVGIVWVTISFFAFGFCHVPLSILAAKWNDAIAIASSWFFFFFSMAIKMLCDCICHRPMIGIALLLEALTAILHWLCGDETHQCSAFVSVFGRIASGCMICHFFAFGRRLSPRRAIIGPLNGIKKLKFEKTWHMTDKDSHHQQQSQRQHDLFIYSDFVIWLKKFTTNATFSLCQTYKCACLCVWMSWRKSVFIF